MGGDTPRYKSYPQRIHRYLHSKSALSTCLPTTLCTSTWGDIRYELSVHLRLRQQKIRVITRNCQWVMGRWSV